MSRHLTQKTSLLHGPMLLISQATPFYQPMGDTNQPIKYTEISTLKLRAAQAANVLQTGQQLKVYGDQNTVKCL